MQAKLKEREIKEEIAQRSIHEDGEGVEGEETKTKMVIPVAKPNEFLVRFNCNDELFPLGPPKEQGDLDLNDEL